MRTVFFVVFGFGTDFVAFGVTEIVTEHEPLLVPRTDVPERLQYFLDVVPMDRVTLAPAGTEIFAVDAIVDRLMVRPTRTIGAVVVVETTVVDVGAEVVEVVVEVDVVVVVAVTRNLGAEKEMSLIVTNRPATPLVEVDHLVQEIVSAPRLVVSDFLVMFMRLAIELSDASALTLN